MTSPYKNTILGSQFIYMKHTVVWEFKATNIFSVNGAKTEENEDMHMVYVLVWKDPINN